MNSTKKRLYSRVTVEKGEEGFTILLDGRKVKTPARRALVLPTQPLAQAIAQEFADNQEKINPATMPLTRLANTVIDGVVDNFQALAEDIMRFIAADMLFYRADNPTELVERQRAAFDPLIDFIEKKCSCHFLITSGVNFIPQPRSTMMAMKTYINAISSPFVLGGLHTITSLTGSGLIAIAVREQAFDADAVWEVAHMEEDWTIEHWGQDAEAAKRRQFRRHEFDAALAFLDADPSTPHRTYH